MNIDDVSDILVWIFGIVNRREGKRDQRSLYFVVLLPLFFDIVHGKKEKKRNYNFCIDKKDLLGLCRRRGSGLLLFHFLLPL